jgi:hypothetical protein
MKSVFRLAILCSFVSFAIYANAKDKTIKTQPGEIVLSTTKCELKLKQTATGFTFGGVDFATKSPLSKIGSVSLDPKLIQSMNAQAQILDQFQYSSCQQINSVPITDPKRVSLIAIDGLSSFQLAQLALLAQMYSSNPDKLQDAVLKWIVSSGDLMQQVWAKQFTGASDEQTEQRRQASESTAFALGKLGIAADSSRVADAIQNQLRQALQ